MIGGTAGRVQRCGCENDRQAVPGLIREFSSALDAAQAKMGHACADNQSGIKIKTRANVSARVLGFGRYVRWQSGLANMQTGRSVFAAVSDPRDGMRSGHFA